MDRQQIASALRRKVPFTEDELALFFQLGERERYRKNAHLIQQGEEPNHFTLIVKGCVMTYCKDEQGNLHVIQFGTEMWWTGDLGAIFKGGESQYSLKAMSDVEVLFFSKQQFEVLTEKYISFERYFRLLFQNSLISHQQRIKRNITYSAEEKYLAFIEQHPKLELIVPQKFIASYLGITPESLSRLRRRLVG